MILKSLDIKPCPLLVVILLLYTIVGGMRGQLSIHQRVVLKVYFCALLKRRSKLELEGSNEPRAG